MPITIQYDAEGFAANPHVANGQGVLTVEWDDLLQAAITVGRPNRFYVFRHGRTSWYEAQFRLSLVRMALEQQAGATVLTMTSAARSLDPTEKGAVNYFLGMAFCKLFAQQLFNAPWAQHVDIFHRQLGIVLRGRSRPDLVAEQNNGNWLVFESKGRVSPPSNDAKNKAKDQAVRITHVAGRATSFNIGGIFYHRGGEAKFFMRDPKPNPKKPLKVTLPDDAWRYYYAPLAELFFRRGPSRASELAQNGGFPLPGLDAKIRVHPHVMQLLQESRWSEAKEWCSDHAEELNQSGFKPDGIAMLAGPSWSEPFKGIEGMESLDQ